MLVPSTQGRLIVLHAQTLRTVAVLPVAAGADSFEVIPGRDTTGAYVVRSHLTGPGLTECVVELDALDLTGQRRATTRLSDTLNGRAPWCVAAFTGALVVRNPLPPSALAAQVVGRTVTLAWQSPGDTTDFELEIGLAPGSTALRVPVGDTTVVGAAGVLQGTYYVRVRARNEVGQSHPSAELRVDVR
jgi:hypothetical protein